MDERRKDQRVDVNYHANGYDCTTYINEKYYVATLVNISSNGAQLRLHDVPDGQILGYKGQITDDYYEHPYLAGKYYTVAWYKDNSVGISFDERLYREYDALYKYYSVADRDHGAVEV